MRLRFRVWVWGLGFRVQGLCWGLALVIGAEGLGFILGSGFRL